MSLQPEAGLVIRYDYLWRDEEKAGRADGVKDRPCAIVLMSKERPDKSRDVYVCAITHSPPRQGETALEIPDKVAKHLNLDSERMWVKTQEVNKFIWEEGRIPFGVSKTPDGKWSYGMIPKALGQQIYEQAIANSRKDALDVVKRDD